MISLWIFFIRHFGRSSLWLLLNFFRLSLGRSNWLIVYSRLSHGLSLSLAFILFVLLLHLLHWLLLHNRLLLLDRLNLLLLFLLRTGLSLLRGLLNHLRLKLLLLLNVLLLTFVFFLFLVFLHRRLLLGLVASIGVLEFLPHITTLFVAFKSSTYRINKNHALVL